MSDNKDQAIKQLNSLLLETKKALKVNHYQNEEKIRFDILKATDKVSQLLKKAWEISMLYKIENDYLKNELTGILIQVEKIKHNISNRLKTKH